MISKVYYRVSFILVYKIRNLWVEKLNEGYLYLSNFRIFYKELRIIDFFSGVCAGVGEKYYNIF